MNDIIKLSINTIMCPILDVGLYGGICERLPDDITHEEWDELKEAICDISKETISKMIDNVFSNAKLDNFKFKSPKYYNFYNDWVEFDIEIPLEEWNKIINSFDDMFFEYINENFCSYDGFISFYPYAKEEWIKSEDNDLKLSMYIKYKLNENNVDLDYYQEEYNYTLRESDILEELIYRGES